MTDHDIVRRLREAAATTLPTDEDIRAVASRMRRRRVVRRGVTAGVTAAVVVLGAVTVTPLVQRMDRPSRIELADRTATATERRSPDAGSTGAYEWNSLPPSPLDARWGAFSAWTGRELLIWGGYARSGDGGEGPRSDGATYDGGAWSELPAAPLPALMRHNGVGAWTGKELWIVGGTGGEDGRALSRAAAAYRPATRSWRELPAVPEPIVGGAWVGDQLVVVAATADAPRGVYTLHVTDDRWRRLDDLPAPDRASRYNSDLQVLATADHVVVVGLGEIFTLAVGRDAAGAAWRRLPAPGVGDRLTNVRGAVAERDAFVVMLSDGTYRYGLGKGRWSRIADCLQPEPPQPIPLVRRRVDELVAVDVVHGSMHFLSSGTRTWVARDGLDEPRVDATVEVAGQTVVIWGGMGSEQPDSTQGWTLGAF